MPFQRWFLRVDTRLFHVVDCGSRREMGKSVLENSAHRFEDDVFPAAFSKPSNTAYGR
jgi:hypothetical protein